MTTGTQLLNLCLLDAGVAAKGQTPMSEDTNNALRRLNMMLAQWKARRWLVWRLVDTACVCDGSQSYTVGLTQDFNVARPDRIEFAYIRQIVPSQPTPVDWPLTVLQAREDYAAITMKLLAASPSSAIWYDPSFPVGAIYPWPIPNSQYELHILTKQVLDRITNPSDELILPEEYEMAIWSNLVMLLCAAYKLPLDATIKGQAKATLNTIRRSNAQIPLLTMPRGVVQGPTYNIFSDRGV